MRLPKQLPGLKGLLILWGIYGVAWIALEGMLWRVVLLGFLTTAVLLLTTVQKLWGGQTLSIVKWVGITGISGFLLGLGGGILTLILMAVKTGLHAHGPEFRAEEITWLLQQIPLWKTVGLFGGLGLGLITSQLAQKQDP